MEQEIISPDEETTDLVPTDIEDKIIVKSFDRVVQSVINEAQFQILLGRTPKNVIKKRPGRGGKIFSYVPHGYVTAVLNRAFGFDWDFETIAFGDGDHFKMFPEDKANKRPGACLVNGRLTVRIRDPEDPRVVMATITKTATGEREVIRGMTWGSLVKSAESDALKKCASKLGVALDLYWQDADEDYIPPSEETIAAREAEKMAKMIADSDPSLSPRAIASVISEKLGVDVPVNRIVKWIKE